MLRFYYGEMHLLIDMPFSVAPSAFSPSKFSLRLAEDDDKIFIDDFVVPMMRKLIKFMMMTPIRGRVLP